MPTKQTEKNAKKSANSHRFKDKLKSIFSFLRAHKWYVFAFVVAIIIVTSLAYFICRTSLAVNVIYTAQNIKVDQPVIFKLTQHIQPIDTSKITISPAIEGSWKFTQTNISENATLTFTPRKYFKENATYKVTVHDAKRLLGQPLSLPTISFTTEKAPQLVGTGVLSWKEGQVVASDTSFSVTLASENRQLRKLELRTTPAINTTMSIKDDKVFTWKPNSILPHNTDISIEVYDSKNDESLVKKTIHTAPEPSMTSPTTRGNIDQHDNIPITFGQAIDQSSANITFDLPGKGSWQNETTYIFTPENLTPNTTYRFSIAKGLRSKEGGILQNGISGSFSTIGPVTVVGMSPRGGNELSQASQTISFTFSRPVDHTSAEQRFSVSSGQIVGKAWRGNTLLVTVNNLGFQKHITATMSAGVTNASFGIPTSQAYSLSFNTEIRTVKLAVPAFRQQHKATCTAASLRMILAYRGISSDEIGLVNAMGYNPRPADTSTDPPTWDDPQTMFVGSIDGSIADWTAAGPDAPPVARAARAYGRNASYATGITSSWIAHQIHNGTPVIMFGSFRATGNVTWKTPSGATRIMNQTGHATVVIGVKGEPTSPLGFWVNDPLRGTTSYWSRGAVDANITRDPDRQAVLVY